jgi:RimJ/RimL family protein N-acetyltransferase
VPWTDASIETDRTRLRVFTEGDKRVVIRLLSDPEVRRYLGGPVDESQLEAARWATVGERWGVFCIADRVTDEAIGGCSFGRWRGVLELSYELLPEHWGRGLAIEAIGAALDWVWDATEDEAVVAVTQTANLSSLRLLARLGFESDLEFEEFGAPQTQLRLRRPQPA